MLHYRHFIQTNAFHFTYSTETYTEKILRSKIFRKAAGINELSGHFLRVLWKNISELCKLSIKWGNFHDSCQIAQVKSLFKKGSKTNPSNYRAILLLTLISKIIHEQTSSFFYLTMKFYTTINQDFEKTTWHTHVFAW